MVVRKPFIEVFISLVKNISNQSCFKAAFSQVEGENLFEESFLSLLIKLESKFSLTQNLPNRALNNWAQMIAQWSKTRNKMADKIICNDRKLIYLVVDVNDSITSFCEKRPLQLTETLLR